MLKPRKQPQGGQAGVLSVLFCLVALHLYAAPAFGDVHRILALRVSFPPEIPDNPTTSGNGAFDVRAFADARDSLAYPFDAPPHDRAYFEAHLQALSNYYREVSGGKVQIEYDVYPRDPTGSYVLQTPLIEYGNGRTRREIGERIVRLFRDGIRASDQAESTVRFSDYNAFIVFHAGLGGEASQALNDVPSAFISAGDLLAYSDGAIPVDEGAFAVEKGMLLPEAISADGRGGLNGTLARFFASHLGLPGLSDFENDLPAVGSWSLMDTGANNLLEADRLGLQPLRTGAGNTLIGFLPSRPLAWSRIRLGWIEPLVVTRADTVRIAAPHVQSTLPQAVKVPISATEYFLLENRISRLSVHGRIPTISRSEPHGVWLSSDDYDAFIPGSGILIYHIDDAVINASDQTRHINSHPDFEIAFAQYRRGISLEEADGLDDIGNVSASRVIQDGIISFNAIQGGPKDPYYTGNNTVLGPDTTPNSNSNLHYPTGITIEILSPPSDTMTVAIRFAHHPHNWPVTNLSPRPTLSPRAFDLTGDGQWEILRDNAWTATGDSLPGFHLDAAFSPAVGTLSGPAWIAGRGSVQYKHQNGVRDSLTASSSALSAPPVIADFPTTPIDIWGWADGRVLWGAWTPERAGSAILDASIRTIAAGDITGNGQNELVATTANGGIHLVSGNGQSRLLANIPGAGAPAVADLDRNGKDDIAIATPDGVLHILTEDGIAFQSDPVPGGAWSSPVLADLDGDGYVEVLFGGDGKLWAFRFNGVLQTGGALAFPLKDAAGPIEAPPVIADLNGDGQPDIVVGSRDGLVYGLDATGARLPGFPLSVPGPIRTSPLLADLDHDGSLELVAFTENGGIHLFRLRDIDPSLTGTTLIWSQQGGGPGNAGKLLQMPQNQPDAPTGDLLPPKRVYVYPNPVRHGDRARFRFFLSEAADVGITIYNPLGEQVEHLSHPGPVPNTDNEIAWDVSAYASGLYICRVEARNGARREVRFVKAAIIK